MVKEISLTINAKTSDLEQQLNFEAEFGVNQFRDISVPRRKALVGKPTKMKEPGEKFNHFGWKMYRSLLVLSYQRQRLK